MIMTSLDSRSKIGHLRVGHLFMRPSMKKQFPSIDMPECLRRLYALVDWQRSRITFIEPPLN